MAPSRRQPAREVVRDRDGNLFDVGEHRPVTVAELAADVRAGRRFRARDQDTDAVCTQQVLLEVLRGAAAKALPKPGIDMSGLAGAAGMIGEVLTRAASREDEPSRRRARQQPRPRRGPTGFPPPPESQQ